MHTRTGVAFVRLLSAIASLLTVIVGNVHVNNAFQEWREDDDGVTICSGPNREFHFKRTGMYRFGPNCTAMIWFYLFTATFANFG